MSNTISVLVVEDNDVARLLDTKIIKQCNCEVDSASTGAQALDLINHKHYDLVLMDIGLPDTDGLKLTKEIRSHKGDNQTVPIVALTTHEDEGYQGEAISVGMNSYMMKPLTTEKCQQALRQYVLVDI